MNIDMSTTQTAGRVKTVKPILPDKRGKYVPTREQLELMDFSKIADQLPVGVYFCLSVGQTNNPEMGLTKDRPELSTLNDFDQVRICTGMGNKLLKVVKHDTLTERYFGIVHQAAPDITNIAVRPMAEAEILLLAKAGKTLDLNAKAIKAATVTGAIEVACQRFLIAHAALAGTFIRDRIRYFLDRSRETISMTDALYSDNIIGSVYNKLTSPLQITAGTSFVRILFPAGSLAKHLPMSVREMSKPEIWNQVTNLLKGTPAVVVKFFATEARFQERCTGQPLTDVEKTRYNVIRFPMVGPTAYEAIGKQQPYNVGKTDDLFYPIRRIIGRVVDYYSGVVPFGLAPKTHFDALLGHNFDNTVSIINQVREVVKTVSFANRKVAGYRMDNNAMGSAFGFKPGAAIATASLEDNDFGALPAEPAHADFFPIATRIADMPDLTRAYLAAVEPDGTQLNRERLATALRGGSSKEEEKDVGRAPTNYGIKRPLGRRIVGIFEEITEDLRGRRLLTSKALTEIERAQNALRRITNPSVRKIAFEAMMGALENSQAIDNLADIDQPSPAEEDDEDY